MGHLDDIAVEDLQQALDEVEGKKPAQRLIAAIAYKNGISQTELAEWYGVQRRTIYSWLKRLEERPLTQAVSDGQRSGRPRKLSETQQRRLEARLHEAPAEVGYDAETWTPALVRRYLDEQFDVAYSQPSCRRLMKEAGLRHRKRHRSATGGESDRDERDEAASPSGGEWVPE